MENFSENAMKILKARYFKKDEKGNPAGDQTFAIVPPRGPFHCQGRKK